MQRKAWAHKIETILDELFPNPEIPLTYQDPYTLLIAVLLSAQCTDARVNLVTAHLFQKANTPQKMIELTPDEIEKIIRSCGLSNAKSRAIWKLSHMILEEFGGEVPKTFEGLESLPGVGHKTASVVMAHAFHIPAFPVDTHIHRCAQRWHLSKGKDVEETEKDLKRLFAKSKWIKLHLQVIHFARKYCPARGHRKEQCPICRFIKSSSNS